MSALRSYDFRYRRFPEGRKEAEVTDAKLAPVVPGRLDDVEFEIGNGAPLVWLLSTAPVADPKTPETTMPEERTLVPVKFGVPVRAVAE